MKTLAILILLTCAGCTTVKYPNYLCEKKYPDFKCPEGENSCWGPQFREEGLPLLCKPLK